MLEHIQILLATKKNKVVEACDVCFLNRMPTPGEFDGCQTTATSNSDFYVFIPNDHENDPGFNDNQTENATAKSKEPTEQSQTSAQAGPIWPSANINVNSSNFNVIETN